MNVRYPMGVLHSFSIKYIFYDKTDLRLFYFDLTTPIPPEIMNESMQN